ncbi:MAG: siphovirus Gp157 family protein [Hyphomicrobiaceae bacterium]|nr:MAG: siphovirus Gp157 family protein [Hyphomicrobiaceae bacterium]
MKLYQLTDQYQALLDDITNCTDDGVKFDGLVAQLDAIEEDLVAKLEACAKMQKALDARAKVFKNEETFFKNKAKAANSSAEGLEQYIKLQMEKVGMEEVKGKTLKIKLCKNGNPSLICDGEIPDDYTVPQPSEANNEKIRQELLEGKELPFARLEYGKHIRIS